MDGYAFDQPLEPGGSTDETRRDACAYELQPAVVVAHVPSVYRVNDNNFGVGRTILRDPDGAWRSPAR